MIARISHIDAISRKNGADAFFIDFVVPLQFNGNRLSALSKPNNGEISVRDQIIEWLGSNGICWEPCGDFACLDRYDKYRGQIYIDVPCDPQNSIYRRVIEFLETPNGASRFDGVECKICPHELALKNKSHDQIGFWDKWAEEF